MAVPGRNDSHAAGELAVPPTGTGPVKRTAAFEIHKTRWSVDSEKMGPGGTIPEVTYLIGQAGGVSRTPADVFETVFLVFVILGTLVGVVVVAYTLSKAWRYRDDGEREKEDTATGKKVTRPTLGELPTGSGGGKKLFVSFGISAVIVLSLIVWTYSALLFVDDTPNEVSEDAIEIDVVGEQFAWTYTYPNGHTTTTLRIPEGQPIRLNVTSSDVWHAYGIKEFRVKTDAIPGQTTTAWFTADQTGEYEAVCYELCGSGHSAMRGDVVVMEPDEYQNWYQETMDDSTSQSMEEPDDSTSEPVSESVAEPAGEPVSESVAEPAGEPVSESVAEPGAVYLEGVA